jgi:hypothetical protein
MLRRTVRSHWVSWLSPLCRTVVLAIGVVCPIIDVRGRWNPYRDGETVLPTIRPRLAVSEATRLCHLLNEVQGADQYQLRETKVATGLRTTDWAHRTLSEALAGY